MVLVLVFVLALVLVLVLFLFLFLVLALLPAGPDGCCRPLSDVADAVISVIGIQAGKYAGYVVGGGYKTNDGLLLPDIGHWQRLVS